MYIYPVNSSQFQVSICVWPQQNEQKNITEHFNVKEGETTAQTYLLVNRHGQRIMVAQ